MYSWYKPNECKPDELKWIFCSSSRPIVICQIDFCLVSLMMLSMTMFLGSKLPEVLKTTRWSFSSMSSFFSRWHQSRVTPLSYSGVGHLVQKGHGDKLSPSMSTWYWLIYHVIQKKWNKMCYQRVHLGMK